MFRPVPGEQRFQVTTKVEPRREEFADFDHTLVQALEVTDAVERFAGHRQVGEGRQENSLWLCELF